jgi:hypothetical protein
LAGTIGALWIVPALIRGWRRSRAHAPG